LQPHSAQSRRTEQSGSSSRDGSCGARSFRAIPPGGAHGIDVDELGNGTATEQRVYQLIRQAKPIADRQFEIEFQNAGAAAFSFTFG
jgi:hypothetical protein